MSKLEKIAILDLKGIKAALHGKCALRNPKMKRGVRRPASVKQVYQEIGLGGTTLLSTNIKVEKGIAKGWITSIMNFASAKDAKRIVKDDPAAWGLTPAQAKDIVNVCPSATPGCMATCLVGSGHGGMGADIFHGKINHTTAARIKRQLKWQFDGEAFFTVLVIEIAKEWAKAYAKGASYAVRLNGTSDIDFENYPVTVSKDLKDYLRAAYGVIVTPKKYKNIYEVFSASNKRAIAGRGYIQFYDYTKVGRRYIDWLYGTMPSNYYLIFSLGETPLNRNIALKVLNEGRAVVAVPFLLKSAIKGRRTATPLPKTLTFINEQGAEFTFPVTDADETDLRFLDPPGTIAGLHAKLPTDKGRKKAVGKSDFLLPVKPGDMHPAIYTYKKGVVHGGGARVPLATNPRAFKKQIEQGIQELRAYGLSPAKAKRVVAQIHKMTPPSEYLDYVFWYGEVLDAEQNPGTMWSGKATKKIKYHTPVGLFLKKASGITRGLLESAHGDRGLAMKRLTFYMNRAGPNVSNKRELNKAKMFLSLKRNPLPPQGKYMYDILNSYGNRIDTIMADTADIALSKHRHFHKLFKPTKNYGKIKAVRVYLDSLNRRPSRTKKPNPAKKKRPVQVPTGRRNGSTFTSGGNRYTVISYKSNSGKRVRYAREV